MTSTRSSAAPDAADRAADPESLLEQAVDPTTVAPAAPTAMALKRSRRDGVKPS
jgi:hypothetical protein